MEKPKIKNMKKISKGEKVNIKLSSSLQQVGSVPILINHDLGKCVGWATLSIDKKHLLPLCEGKNRGLMPGYIVKKKRGDKVLEIELLEISICTS